MRYAHTIFCDDVRQEVGGKMSLMGIYTGDLLVPQQPWVLPKLCVVTTVVTPSDKPFETLVIRIATANTVLLEQELPSDAINQIQSALKKNTDPADPCSKMAVVVNLAIAPLAIDSSFTVKVMAIADGEELNSGRLKVGFAAPWPPVQ
jgi:hypothetical protein